MTTRLVVGVLPRSVTSSICRRHFASQGVSPASTATSTSGSASASASTSASTPAPPPHLSSQRHAAADTALSVSNIFRPGGRSSVSGLVATVFGCTGFLGKYTVHALGSTGSQVICPHRGDGMNSRHLKLMGDLGQIVPIPFDVHDELSVRRAVARSNVVINLIGAEAQTSNFSYDDTHVKITHRIAKIAKEAGVERFVQIGTLGADNQSNSEWIKTKTLSEQVARDYFPGAIILRCGPIVGAEDNFANKFAGIADKFLFSPIVNGGSARVQPIMVTDVADALLNAVTADNSLGKTYELGGDEILTYKQWYDAIYQTIYREPDIVDIPYELLELYGKACEYLPSRWHHITTDVARQWTKDKIVSKGALTIRDLGITPLNVTSKLPGLLVTYRGPRGPVRWADQDLK